MQKRKNYLLQHNFQFIGLIKVQNRVAVTGIDYPAALSVIAPYPAFFGAVVPDVPAARYCIRSFWFFCFFQEAKNSELKHRHGYDVASSSGLIGMEMQGKMAIFTVNLKKIIKLMGEK